MHEVAGSEGRRQEVLVKNGAGEVLLQSIQVAGRQNLVNLVVDPIMYSLPGSRSSL